MPPLTLPGRRTETGGQGWQHYAKRLSGKQSSRHWECLQSKWIQQTKTKLENTFSNTSILMELTTRTHYKLYRRKTDDEDGRNRGWLLSMV